METANMFDIASLAAVVGMFLAVMAFAGGVLYRVGVLSNKVEQTDNQITEMREEFRREMSESREEFRREIRDLREEGRRNHQQLLQALAHHSHDSDTGFAIFRIPPGTENPAS